MAFKLESSREDLLDLLYKDELTRIFNRRYMNRQLVELAKDVIEKKGTLSFLMIDVDHFKGFNDTYGHDKGDKALIWVAQTIAAAAGDLGVPVRYAGDEFVVLLPGVPKKEAIEKAEKLRSQVGDSKIQLEGLDRKVSFTLSVGVSNFPEDTGDPSQLLTLADKASYSSKKRGRNRVSTLEEEVVEALDASTIYRYFPCRTLTGRDELMKKLTALILPSLEKTRPMITLHGLPGSGKSRILDELFSISDSQRSFLIRTKGASYSVGQPFVELLEPLSLILKNDPELASRAVLRLSPIQVQAVRPFLPVLSRYTINQQIPPGIDPGEQMEVLLEGLKEIILEISSEKPIFIFFDEFHFSNLGTRMLLGRVKEDKRGGGVGLFAAVCLVETVKIRDQELIEFFNYHGEKSLLEKISLKPLSKGQTVQMADDIIHGISEHPELCDFIHRHSEGNPGKVEDLLKKLIAKKRISLEKGRLMVDEVSEEDALDTAGVVAGLPGFFADDEVISLLSKVSVVGREFNLELLKRLDHRSEGHLYGLLEKAEKRDLISRRVTEDEEDVYEFRGDKVKSDLYTKLDDAMRRDLHRRVGLAEKDINKEHIEQALSKLAYHFERAGDHPEAMYYLSRLAREFQGLFSPTLLEVHVGHLPDADDDWEEEKILTGEEKEQALRVCRRFKMTIGNLERYPAKSEIVRGSIDSAYMELNKLLEKVEIVTFAEADGKLLINREPPDIDESSDFKEEDFIEIMDRSSLKGISFRKGLTRDDFVRFQDIMITYGRERIDNEGGWAALLEKNKIRNILANQRVYITMGRKELLDSYRVKKEKVIVKQKVYEEEPGRETPVKEPGPIPLEFMEQMDIIREKYANDPVLMQFLIQLKETLERLPPGQLEQKPTAPSVKVSKPVRDEEDTAPGEAEKAKKAQAADSASSRRISEMMERYNLLIMDKIKQDIDVLIHELAYPDLEIVQLAASALLNRGREVIDPLFYYLLDTDNVVARKTGITILRKLEGNIGKRFLEALLGDTNARQKETILHILKEFPEASLMDSYRVLLRDSDPRVRRVFLKILESRDQSHYMDMLIEALWDPNEEVARDAAESLGNQGNPSAVPHLTKLLEKKWIIFNDGRFKLQEEACKALGRIGTDDALNVLVNTLKTSFINVLKRDKPPTVRAAAAFALGYFPKNKVADIMDRAASDPSPVVRSAVRLASSMHDEWKDGENGKKGEISI